MNRGFSLLELSIVLIIIGLLAGGVMVGNSMVRASEIRTVSVDIQQYSTAMNGFRNKYSAMAGDMRNAQIFWGTAASCPGTFATPSTDATTCNGNGDGRISWLETWRVWQHLSSAGLVTGQYTGVHSAGGVMYGTAGENIPVSKVGRYAGFAYNWRGDQNGTGMPYPGSYGNTLLLGWLDGVDASTLKAEEMFGIDTKLDDGKPGTGRIRPYKHSSRGHCANSDIQETATYRTDSPFYGCNLMYITGF